MNELRYRLALEVREDSLDFLGRVEVGASPLPETLTLDAVGLTVRTATSGGRALAFGPGKRPETVEIVGIPPGARSVSLGYTGKIDDPGIRGFYVSPLRSARAYTTYFEPVSARRLLPCVDRPDAKAVFEVEVTAPADLTVISNQPVASAETLPGGTRRTRFLPTPPMPTYLLYLGIGPFEEIAGTRNDPKVILAAAPGASEDGRFALEQATRAIDYFAHYYGEPYPLPKLHLLALPQIGTGAMENWGAIAFQEMYLLVDDRSPVSAKMRTVEVVCHEVAHQWFGDLVTMRWWNDLWLNESFASFVAIKASAALFPDWSPWDEFLAGRTAGAMLWDSLPHTHPIRVEVNDPLEIRQIFDEISYGKGGSVLRMAEGFVGEAAFAAGVSRYLAEHRWGNAESSDLWKAIADASEPGVARVFAEWVDRPGFPVVTASLQGESLHLTQRRFSSIAPVDATPWPIPLTVRGKDRTERRLFDTPTLTVDGVGGAPLLNPGRTGFYRVRYEGPLRDRILGTLTDLSAVDRWGLLNDELAFLLAGEGSLDDYLAVVRRLGEETDPFVVSELTLVPRLMYPLLHRIPKWEREMRSVVVAQSDRLGVRSTAGDSDRTRALREELLMARVRLDPDFAGTLAREFGRVDSLEPNLIRPVLAAYALGAGPAEIAELRRRLDSAASAEAKANVAGGLGLLRDRSALRDSLELVFSGALPVGPWIPLFAAAVYGNPDRSETVFRFLTERADALIQGTAGSGMQSVLFQNAVPSLGLGQPDAMRAFAARQRFPESARAVVKGLDLLDVYLRVIERAG